MLPTAFFFATILYGITFNCAMHCRGSESYEIRLKSNFPCLKISKVCVCGCATVMMMDLGAGIHNTYYTSSYNHTLKYPNYPPLKIMLITHYITIQLHAGHVLVPFLYAGCTVKTEKTLVHPLAMTV